MYVASMKDDYSLFDAFNFLGIRLYGPEWTGYEVWRDREEDPAPILEARIPLTNEVELVTTQISEKHREQKEVEGRKEIHRVNNEIDNLKRKQSDLFHQLNDIGDVHSSVVKDHESWKRFERAEGIFLKALCNGDLTAICTFGMLVKENLWAEFPEGFGYSLEHSLIFLPSFESSKLMNSGYIKKKQFEDWLETVIPVVPHEGAKLSDEQRALVWFKALVPLWDGRMKRDQFKEMALAEYPGLSGHGFKRIWDKEATPNMKRPGAKKQG